MRGSPAGEGWYADPDGSGGLRWFDGRRWTAHRAPPPDPGWQPPGYWTAPPSPWPPAQWSQPAPRNNGLAIAALACAICGLVFGGLPSLLGIVFGFVARRQIRRSGGRQGGASLALAGIVVGLCVVVLYVVFFTVTSIHSTSSG